jgi:hypothetical protein
MHARPCCNIEVSATSLACFPHGRLQSGFGREHATDCLHYVLHHADAEDEEDEEEEESDSDDMEQN